MTNEEIIEEILIKSHELGVFDQVSDLYKTLIGDYDHYKAYEIAFYTIVSEE